jgi:hypothetical protein
VRFEELSLGLEELDLLLQLVADLVSRAFDGVARGHVLRRREDREVLEARIDLARERVEVGDLLDLVAEHRDAVRRLHVRGLHLDDVTANAKTAAAQKGVVARVLDIDELAQHHVAVDLHSHAEKDSLLLVLHRRAEPVDTGDRGDDQDVPAHEQRARGRVAQPVDVVVDRRVLFDVEVGLGDVGLGLVVVVVGDEVLDRVLREELAKFVAELGGERLVVRDHERRLLYLLDDPGHRGRLSGAGRAQQGLVLVARLQARRE